MHMLELLPNWPTKKSMLYHKRIMQRLLVLQLKSDNNKYYFYCFHNIAIEDNQALMLVKLLFLLFQRHFKYISITKFQRYKQKRQRNRDHINYNP